MGLKVIEMPIEYPKELHILDNEDAKKSLELAYRYMKTEDGEQVSDEYITHELKEAVVVMEAAKKEAEEQAKLLGVALVEGQDGLPLFTQTWNQYHQCIELTATIAGNPDPNSFSYEGRQIKISIQLSASNTNFSPDDIDTMFEDVYKAAQDLNNNDNYLVSIKQIYEQFKTIGVLCPDEDSIEKLKQDYAEQLANNTINLDEIRERCTNLMRLFNEQLALAQLRVEINNPTYMPSDIKELKPYIVKIKKQAIENTSKQRRPIIINAYRQRQNENTPPGHANYNMRIYKPNSDTPSTQRDLAGGTFSNDWNGTLKNVVVVGHSHIPEDGITLVEEDRRSSSIAKLHGSIEDIRDKEEVYEAFKKLVIQYARDEIIAKLNAGEELPKELIIKEAYITLLSPFITKAAAHNLPVGAMAIFKAENEDSQLAYTRYCLERISEEKQLKFSEADIQFIIEHTHKSIIIPYVKSLEAIEIKHRSYFCNYMVNSVGGLFRTEKLDWGNKNYKYFVDGNLQRREYILEYFKENLPKVNNTNAQYLLNELDALIGKDSRNPCSIEQLQKIKKLIDWDISQIGLQLNVNIELAANIKQVFQLYITIEAYFAGSKELSNSRIAASYLASALDAQLATLLGFTPHHTCKSGIDRTGLQATIKEALLTDPADILEEKNADELLQRIYIGLQHGSGRAIKVSNNPGARGLQIPATVLWGHRDINGKDSDQIVNFLKEQQFDRMGKMAKAIYEVKSGNLPHLHANDNRVTSGVLFETHKDLMLDNYPSTDAVYHGTYDINTKSITYNTKTKTNIIIVTETKAKDAIYNAVIKDDADIYEGYRICLNNANITAKNIGSSTFTVSGVTSANVKEFMSAFDNVFNDDGSGKHVKIAFTKQSQQAINEYLKSNHISANYFKMRCKEVATTTSQSSPSSSNSSNSLSI
jgi:hypothetical protein